VTQAADEVGPALFFSLLVITLSFLPVFTLEAQEGRLFSPLAFTKTYAMAAAAGLSVTLVPVLMGYLIRGRIPREDSNPLNRFLMAAYRPLLEAVLRFPKATLVVAAVLLALTAFPVSRLGGEFLPALDEGDLLYMPSALPGLSVSKATELLQQTDRLIKTVPEVERVFGKAGRADTATDPAPLEMFETTIQLKPREQWRPRMTPGQAGRGAGPCGESAGLVQHLGAPHPQPHRHAGPPASRARSASRSRAGPSATIDRLAGQIEAAVKGVPGVSSGTRGAIDRRPLHSTCSWIAWPRLATDSRWRKCKGMSPRHTGGGSGGRRWCRAGALSDQLLYPREVRDSLERLRPFAVRDGPRRAVLLQEVASISLEDGPPMLRSENARLSGWVYVDVRGRDLRSVVRDMQAAVRSRWRCRPATPCRGRASSSTSSARPSG
jgi:Cu(I)/Ag(I) efflux system membrane protein CusA/SilA